MSHGLVVLLESLEVFTMLLGPPGHDTIHVCVVRGFRDFLMTCATREVPSVKCRVSHVKCSKLPWKRGLRPLSFHPQDGVPHVFR